MILIESVKYIEVDNDVHKQFMAFQGEAPGYLKETGNQNEELVTVNVIEGTRFNRQISKTETETFVLGFSHEVEKFLGSPMQEIKNLKDHIKSIEFHSSNKNHMITQLEMKLKNITSMGFIQRFIALFTGIK